MVGLAVDLERGSAWVSYRLLRARRAPERFADRETHLADGELDAYEAFFSDRLASAGESHLLRVDGERATVADASYRVTGVEPFEPVLVADPLVQDGDERRLLLSRDPGPTAVPELHEYELALPAPLEGGEVIELRVPGDYQPYGGHSLSLPDGLALDGCVGAVVNADGSVELDSAAGNALLLALGREDDDRVPDAGIGLAGRLRSLEREGGPAPGGEALAVDGEELLDLLVAAGVVTVGDDGVALSGAYRETRERVREDALPLTDGTMQEAARAAAAGGATYRRLAERLLDGDAVTPAQVVDLLALSRGDLREDALLPAAAALRAFH